MTAVERSPREAALAYAAAGWPVFPCRWGSKEPATSNGFYDATTDQAQIREWWRRDPARNVAIATGAPGPDVVDVDVREDGSGFAALNQAIRAGLIGGHHAIVRTPSTGMHLYYQGTDQRSGSVRGRHLDFRSQGGYVVAPPSYAGGARYVVVKHEPATGVTVSWDAFWSRSRRRGAPPADAGPPDATRGRRAWTASSSGLRRASPGTGISRCSTRPSRRRWRASWTAPRWSGSSMRRAGPGWRAASARPGARSPARSGRRPPCALSPSRLSARWRRADMTATETRAHGTRARYARGPGPGKGPGCRCAECTAANRAAGNQRSRAILYGRWQPYVDAGRAREHLRALAAAGIGHRRAGELAGVSPGSLSKILYGGPGNRPPSKRVRPQTAAAILALRPSPGQLAPGALVDITCTRRRAQALVACGWSQARLARELGLTAANFCGMLRRDQVTAATARAVGELYDRLWNRPPPEHDQHTRIAAARARNHAGREGWAPPLAWDDDQIDDPHAHPAQGWKRPARNTRRSADLAEDAEELFRREGYTREHAAARLGVSLPALQRALDVTRHAGQAGHEAQRARFAQAAAAAPQAGYEAEAG